MDAFVSERNLFKFLRNSGKKNLSTPAPLRKLKSLEHILQGFAGGEFRNLLGRNLDLFAGLRVPGLASFSLAYLECPKATKVKACPFFNAFGIVSNTQATDASAFLLLPTTLATSATRSALFISVYLLFFLLKRGKNMKKTHDPLAGPASKSSLNTNL